MNRIPIMAKQVLDLYMLYRLVTEKGGLVEVINKKLWREITKGLNLPTSITSAAFTLRTQSVHKHTQHYCTSSCCWCFFLLVGLVCLDSHCCTSTEQKTSTQELKVSVSFSRHKCRIYHPCALPYISSMRSCCLSDVILFCFTSPFVWGHFLWLAQVTVHFHSWLLGPDIEWDFEIPFFFCHHLVFPFVTSVAPCPVWLMNKGSKLKQPRLEGECVCLWSSRPCNYIETIICPNNK